MRSNTLRDKEIGKINMEMGDHDFFTIYEHVGGDISIRQDFGFDVEMTRRQAHILVTILSFHLDAKKV